MSKPATDPKTCPSCGLPRTSDTRWGLCVNCLVQLAIDQGPGDGEADGGAVAEREGDQIGPFKLLERLGEGGFGVVYVAEQREPVRRRVALKILKAGMDTRQVVARFEAERQALAVMEHPGIARVFDAGCNESGRPYFVMELVRGVPITTYCDENHLTTGERLDLFLQVCRAIRHAHLKGIIHRDIKPGNILVTLRDGEPVPKVIDFGIAKATQGDLTDQTVYTRFHAFLGTPAYISPEQAEMTSVDVDTRADIYSLGVLLYELLVGRTPFDAGELLRGGYDAMRRVIRERDPLRPSTRLSGFTEEERTATARRFRTEPVRHILALRGDLDWIVMKCLEKDRSRRYDTAGSLAADIQRHLNDEPVLARPPTLRYRLRKLARRHKGAVVATLGIVAALVLGTVVSVVMAFRATFAEAEAVREKEKTRVVLAESALALADSLYQQGRGLDMKAVLQGIPADLRDRTWDYLMTRSDASFVTLDSRPEEGGFHGTAPHPRLPGVFAVTDLRGEVAVLNLRTGERLAGFTPTFSAKGDSGPLCLAFSPDGERLAIGHPGEGGIVMHRWRDGARLAGWSAPGSERLAFSPDGQWLLQTARPPNGRARDFRLQLFDANTGRPAWNAPATGRGVFLADGQQVLRITRAGGMEVLRSDTGKVVRRLRNGPSRSTAMAVSPDGRLAAIGDGNYRITGVDLEEDRVRFTIHSQQIVKSLAFDPEGQWFVSVAGNNFRGGNWEQFIRVWRSENGSPVRTLVGGQGAVRTAAFQAASGVVLVAGPVTKAWDLIGPPPRWTWHSGIAEGFGPFAFWGSDKMVLAPSRGDDAALQRLEPEGPTVVWQPKGGFLRVSASADGTRAAMNLTPQSGVRGFAVLRLDKPEPEIVGVVPWPFPGSRAGSFLRLSPHGDRLAFVGRLTEPPSNYEPARTGVKILEIPSGVRGPDLEDAGIQTINDLQWLDEGRAVAAVVTVGAERGAGGSSEQLVRWETTTGRRVQAATNATPMGVLAVTRDSRRLAEGGHDRNIRVRDAATLAVQREFRAHDGTITGLAWHPSKPLLASTSNDLVIRVWNVASGRLLREYLGPTRTVTALQFSPSGRYLAVAAKDQSVRIWETGLPAD